MMNLLPGVNPFVIHPATGRIDCKQCPHWSEIAGRCQIDPAQPKPCGQPHARPDRVDFGRRVLG